MQKHCTHKKNCYKLIYLGGMQYFAYKKVNFVLNKIMNSTL